MSKMKSISIPDAKIPLVNEAEKAAKKEGLTMSALFLRACETYVKEHGSSQNPQTKLTLFEQGLASAIPNLFELARHPDQAARFYSNLKSKKEYDEVDKGLNTMLASHNGWLKKNG